MAIGDLYNASNVIVGQAAAYFANGGTALPSLSTLAAGGLLGSTGGWNGADPFDPTWILPFLVTNSGSTAFTMTYVRDGKTATTASLTVAGLTAAAIATALAGLSTVGGAGNVTVTGAASPWTVVMKGPAEGGVLTATGTGGTVAVLTSPWLPCGATDQGWQFGANKSTQTIGIEEQSTPVATTVTSQAVSLAASLSEDITRTLTLALNATAQAVAPTTASPGFDNVQLTDNVLQYAVVLVTQNPEGFGRIIYAPAWTQLSNVSVNFRRATEKRMFPVGFQTVCQTNLIQLLNFTAAHS